MLCSERRWCDIDYDLSIADSDRLLAEALTPRAVVSLVRVAIRAERVPLQAESPLRERNWLRRPRERKSTRRSAPLRADGDRSTKREHGVGRMVMP